MKILTITSNEAGQRLDKLLAKYLDGAGKGFLYKMLRKKNITLNGSRCDGSERLKEGDEVKLFLADETIEKFSSGKEAKTAKLPRSAEPLNRIYEDSHILLVNKPYGVLSQKAKDSDISLNEQILSYLLDSGSLTAGQLRTFRPSVCNRLDRNTSGLVAAGKSLGGLQALSAVLKDRSLHKYYQCLVMGNLQKVQRIQGFLKKDEKTNRVTVSSVQTPESAPIVTEYEPIGGNGAMTLLKVTLITGKSHQIRAHLASIGHPIAGDFKYGNRVFNERMKQCYGLSHQLLHSWKLVMPQDPPDPLGYLAGQEFEAPLPPLFSRILEKEGIRRREV